MNKKKTILPSEGITMSINSNKMYLFLTMF